MILEDSMDLWSLMKHCDFKNSLVTNQTRGATMKRTANSLRVSGPSLLKSFIATFYTFSQ